MKYIKHTTDLIAGNPYYVISKTQSLTLWYHRETNTSCYFFDSYGIEYVYNFADYCYPQAEICISENNCSFSADNICVKPNIYYDPYDTL